MKYTIIAINHLVNGIVIMKIRRQIYVSAGMDSGAQKKERGKIDMKMNKNKLF